MNKRRRFKQKRRYTERRWQRLESAYLTRVWIEAGRPGCGV